MEPERAQPASSRANVGFEDQELGAALRRFVFGVSLADPEEGIDDRTSLLRAGILDSTGILDLVANIEEAYGFEVADEEIVPENFDSIRGLRGYVRSKTST